MKSKTKGYEVPTCKKCGDEYHLPDGYDATEYCNPCAQELAVELLSALEDIAEPMKKIQADAKAEGMLIDGPMALNLCQDANWLRDKARAAIKGRR